MAQTYKKALRNAKFTTLMNTEKTVADTTSEFIATQALAEFDGKKTIKIKGENDTTLIPFHAVKKVESGITSADATKSDAYCDEDGGEKKMTINFCNKEQEHTPKEVYDFCAETQFETQLEGRTFFATDSVEIMADGTVFSTRGIFISSETPNYWLFNDADYSNYERVYEDVFTCGSYD